MPPNRTVPPNPVVPPKPTKIVAVHTSYRSRAAERGILPPWPSYFLKPPNTIARDGDVVKRPPGCELLAFEGEVALIMSGRVTRVTPGTAWEHVGWVTAANDFGVYDLRYADKGSNLRSKGIDGYTPLGPELLDARGLDPDRVRLRAWVNGTLAQDAVSGEEILFGFADIVADISRLTTLEPGDVILTGTPTGSTVVAPGDIVEVEVTAGDRSTGRLRSPIAEADYDLRTPGAMPRADDAQRAAAFGTRHRSTERMEATAPDAILSAVGAVSTATLASQLKKHGYESVTLDRLRVTNPDLTMAGFARTVRYVPYREDLFRSKGGGFNAQKQAVEQVRPGEVLVIEARGDPTAGTVGDILALRAQVRGAAGIVTDGAIRDSRALGEMSIPVFYGASHPAVLGRRHVPWEANVTVACAGVTIQPGDIVAGDADGVIVVPRDVAREVAEAAAEQERQEAFITERVAGGDPIDGLYPLGPKWRPAYEAWLKQCQPGGTTPRNPPMRGR
ncbi:MAG: fumarylacetoacetate hydrolase family protein [Nocardiopsaceae bacterium]|nr:fumarylacetoacetate hydrolase family protein [Nocardiopsaceae bacterium]